MSVSVARLVEMFEQRPRPESGVISRSRLRAWFLEVGGSEEQWPDLVRALVARKLWIPWHGDDISLLDDGPPIAGYRDQASTEARHATFSTLRGAHFIVTASLLLCGILLLFLPGGWMWSLGFLLLIGFDLLVMTGRFRRYEVSVGLRDVRISSKRSRIELELQSIRWVDVETNGARDSVIVCMHDGGTVQLADQLEPDVALSFCRLIESAMSDAERFELANRTKVRAEPALESELEPATEAERVRSR